MNPTLKIARAVDYLRISVTDRCNLRCSYCIPKEGIYLQPHEDILRFEEIVTLVKIFVSLGIRRIRITGGEPLVRKGIVGLIRQLNDIKAIEEICLTTNGVLLSEQALNLKEAGVSRINISLDTLREERFSTITGSDYFSQVIEGISKAKEAGFKSLGLNTVVMNGINSDEITDFVKFALKQGLILKFIEFMKVTPLWQERLFMPIEEIRDVCIRNFSLEKVEYRSRGPAQYYRLGQNLIGFIKTSRKNCSSCCRLRLTSTGELKSCLYQPQGASLRDILRKGIGIVAIERVIGDLISLKSDLDYTNWENSQSYMCSLGG